MRQKRHITVYKSMSLRVELWLIISKIRAEVITVAATEHMKHG